MENCHFWNYLFVFGFLGQIVTGYPDASVWNWKREHQSGEPVCEEEILGYLPNREDMKEDMRLRRQYEIPTRTQNPANEKAQKVDKFEVYDDKGSPIVESIVTLCRKGHNILRKKHKNTPPLKYNKAIAKTAQAYAEKLAKNGIFEHDSKISGMYGENLYRMSNTYDLIANPAHANLAWYGESWKPNKAVMGRNYDYKFNPSASIFNISGVGHFTQMMWKNSKYIGCGVATAKYIENGRHWRRTIIIARYARPGNIIGRFTLNVKPLSNKHKTLEKDLGKEKLFPSKPRCISSMPLVSCSLWKAFGWCNRPWAISDCNCTCGKKKS